ncbi:hypothetical protein GTR02_20155, partial [Kineococcus sp. R8]
MDLLDDDDADADGAPGPRERGSAVAWVLAVAAAVPVAVAAEACRRVMTGGLDRVFTATYGGYPAPSAALRQRFEWMVTSIPVGTALLASAVGVLAVAGLHLAGRRPGRGPRSTAAGVGGAVVLSGLAFLAGVLNHVLNAPATTPATVAFVDAYPPFLQFGPQAAEVVLTVVLAAVAAVALVRRPGPGAARG